MIPNNWSVIAGADLNKPLDALFINAPLRDYALRPRVNDFTLPVLGMAYIATYAKAHGFNVGVLDAEAHGLGPAQAASLANEVRPRWVGLNLLAPTYEMSATIAEALDSEILVMLGGHQAKAMPTQILRDPRMKGCVALVMGEAETRVLELLRDQDARRDLPLVMWLDRLTEMPAVGRGSPTYLVPDINRLPFVDRSFLAQDPYQAGDRLEANMVGARGCPYNCSFCGAAVSANKDIEIRTRTPANIVQEMEELRSAGVTAFRFVDDLFLGARRVIGEMMDGFAIANVGSWAKWDATGRINVLDRLDDAALARLATNGLREVALGIESGSERILDLTDKRITPDMAVRVVSRLLDSGVNVKGYFILGFPSETEAEIDLTVALIEKLWEVGDRRLGSFRASVFEYRPYPGTPDWDRLMATGKYSEADLLNYSAVDLTAAGVDEAMRERDEFNFSINLQLSVASIAYIRDRLVHLSRIQYKRKAAL
ncbi:MAG TPA: radical SAM protein [Pseudolysinimonas sp.]